MQLNSVRHVRSGPGLLPAALILLAACETRPSTEPPDGPAGPELTVAIVSNPTANLVARASGSPSLSGTAATDVAYISLPPGALPNAESLRIRNGRNGAIVDVHVVDGGFDPVAIPASAGDTLDVTIRTVAGTTETYIKVVPERRPPIVIRTDPPPKKRDVPLNAVMLVVFSEPMDASLVEGPAIVLRQGAVEISGTLAFADDAQVAAVLTPSSPLAPNTDYLLVISTDAADQDGDALATVVQGEFTTTASTLGRIAFVRDSSFGSGSPKGVLHVMAGDGSGVTRLTSPLPSADVLDPAWSPDGSRLAFVSWRDGTTQIYVMQAYSGAPWEQVTASPGGQNLRDPAWSPDGSKLALIAMDWFFSASGQFQYNAWRTNVSAAMPGDSIRPLWDEPPLADSLMAHHFSADWSPDGTQVAYWRLVERRDASTTNQFVSGQSGVFIINADGSSPVRLADGRVPAWSPDGTHIAFVVWPYGADWADCLQTDIYVMGRDGSGIRRLTVGSRVSGWDRLAWSPDGTAIAFTGLGDCSGAVRDIYVANADGSGTARLTNTGTDHSPTWTR